jgi:DUF1680 family protein
MITATQSFATGAWGPNESFSEPGSGDLYRSLSGTHRGFETPCGSYAHFKLTRYLLRVTRDGRYGDSLERILYNTVLGAKPLQADGRAFYYSDYNLAGRKTYFPDAWPCCSGTLPQVTADYHVLPYFHDHQGLYVNLYLPSTLRWTAPDGAQVAFTQETQYPLESKILLRIRTSRPSTFPIRLRIPEWAGGGAFLRVKGTPAPLQVSKGFATIAQTWKDGDILELDLPLRLNLKPIDDAHSETVALQRGPLVLFALTDEPLTLSRQQLLSASSNGSEWQVRTSSRVTSLRPFFAIQDQPYQTYLRLA